MDDTFQLICFGVLTPIVVTVVCVLPWIRVTPREDGRDRYGWRLPVGLGIAVALAFFALHGWPSEQWQSLAWVPLAGAAMGVLMALTRRSAVMRLVAFAVLAAGTTACVWPVLGRESWTIKLLAGVGTFVVAVGLETLARSRPDPVTAFTWAAAAAASSAIVLVTGFMTLAVPYGALSVALAAIGVLALVRRRTLSLADGPVAVIAPLIVLTPITAWLYASFSDDSLPRSSFVLPTVASLLPWLGAMTRRRAAWLDVVVRFLVVLVPCGLALWLVLAGGGEAEDADPYADMYRDMMGG